MLEDFRTNILKRRQYNPPFCKITVAYDSFNNSLEPLSINWAIDQNHFVSHNNIGIIVKTNYCLTRFSILTKHFLINLIELNLNLAQLDSTQLNLT